MGIITVFGKGNQFISWIHPDDLSGLVLHLVRNHHLSGVYNAAAPEPVTNKEMAGYLKSITRSRAVIIHIPKLMLQLVLGELSEAVLEGQRVSPAKIIRAGYEFRFPDAAIALQSLLKK